MKHDAILSGLRDIGSKGIVAPTILRFEETDFVAAFLADLSRSDWRARLQARTVTPAADGVAVVEQPVHRAFHLVVTDARCFAPGMPRLDPVKAVSAGVVIRRRRKGQNQGWLRSPDAVLGWRPLPANVDDLATRYDPDAALRRAHLAGRNANALTRLDRLPGAGDLASEETAPLFPIPPDLAKSIGVSLFYGFLPVLSNQTEAVRPSAPPFARADVAARLPGLLAPSRGGVTLPPVNGTVTQVEMVRPDDAPDQTRGAGLRTLKSALSWLTQETGAFNEGPEANAIRSALNAVSVPDVAPAAFGDWLNGAHRAFLLQDPASPAALPMPSSWPQLTQAQADLLINAALAAMTARWGSAAPLTPRYPAGRGSYDLRCFLRIDDGDGCQCPPRIAWSAPLASFRIKPWFEGGVAPPIRIELPSITQASLKALTPNVSFKVPPELQQHLDRIDLKGLMDGKHTKTSVSFGMICSFSIPIITICAFFILQIFLQLLNIIFWWLPFVRICLPYPIVATEEEDS
ncbi:MAG: hypothetical protein WCC66_13075 [Rhizobiaceae bacterium]